MAISSFSTVPAKHGASRRGGWKNRRTHAEQSLASPIHRKEKADFSFHWNDEKIFGYLLDSMPRRCSFKLELDYPQPLAGVDEAGCAPLAGPVVAGACILDREKFPRGIDDSKNIRLEKREALYGRLVKQAIAWGVGIASVEEIDRLNIYWAKMLAMTRAVEALGLQPAWVLVDGNALPKWQRPSKAIVDGDAKCRSIGAASIIAKVTRDRIMADFALEYPGYGWERNRGYGTPEHWRALHSLGPTPLHRRSFPRVRAAIEKDCAPELVFEIRENESLESHPPQLEAAAVVLTQDIVAQPRTAG